MPQPQTAPPVTSLTIGHFGAFVSEVNVGRVGVAIIACAFAVVCYGIYGFTNPETVPVAPALVVSALALAARPITGHMAQQSFGSILDAVHVLAAALWFGVLAALALAVPSRGAWAIWLPSTPLSPGDASSRWSSPVSSTPSCDSTHSPPSTTPHTAG